MNFLIIFIFITYVHGYIVPSKNVSNRFENIWFPESKLLLWQGQAFSENILIAPKTFKYNKNGDIDLCKDLKMTVAKIQSSLWNGSISNPCARYFCSEEKPYFLLGSTSYLNNSISILKNNDVIHTLLHQYCTKCVDSYQERFDVTLLNRNCSWFNGTFCVNYCPDNYQCFLFSSKNSLCYDNSTKTFYGKVDYIHLIISNLRFFFIPSLYISGNLILLIASIIFIILPEIKYLRDYFTFHSDTYSRIQAVFSMRNQSLLGMLISFIGYMVFCTLDLLNFVILYFSSAFVFLHFIQSVYSWSLIFLIWLRIYNISSKSEEDEVIPLYSKIIWVGIYIITFIMIIFVIIIVVTAPIFERQAQGIQITIIIAILTIFILIIAIVLTILAIRLLKSMSIPSNEPDHAFYFFKLKLTRSILVFNFALIPLFIIASLNVVSYFVLDYFSISFQFFWMQLLMCILSLIFSTILMVTLIHDQKFKNFYFGNKNSF